MSIATRTDTRHAFGADHHHDDGLDHPHDWARDRAAGIRRHGPLAADTANIATPSSAIHDDALYG